MISKDFFKALDELEAEGRIEKEFFLDTLKFGLEQAYKREYGEAKNIAVKINPAKSSIEIEAYKIIVEEVNNADKEISLQEAKEIRSSAKVGEIISEKISPKDFSRVAATHAKQIITQQLGEYKKKKINEEMSQREGEIVTCTVTGKDNNGNILADISGSPLQGIILKNDQLSTDKYDNGRMLRVFVKSIKTTSRRDNQVLLSRTNNGFIKRLLELEVPEIKAGLVEIKKIARDPGRRTKIAVYTKDQTIDPVGACVGSGGMRMQNIVSELNGEPIDIVPWSEEPAEFIAHALSPARIKAVNLDTNEEKARVIVLDEKEFLRAIGKSGCNAKLAVQLTGWKIDIKKLQDIEE